MNPIRHIRNAARALIIRDGKLLSVKMRDNRGIFYVLPGGGQKPGETLSDTLMRECLEETGMQVKVGDLVYIREYIGKNHDFNKRHKGFHQVESVFQCEITSTENLGNGHSTDNLQVGIEWLPLDKLKEIPIYPAVIKKFLVNGTLHPPKLYLGDVN